MRLQMCHRPMAALLLSAAWLGLVGGAPAAFGKEKAPDCNRRCLLESLTTYTEAVTDNYDGTLRGSQAHSGWPDLPVQ